ncbi:hypothetical protein [Phycobacter azelaicus]|uniref:hypothetical protein n=1 Tax=Phycobacter azelaicus TaxID=2668075 RepID=UPI001D019B37|nr:hypothetical protein [Phycobacter azelaicus]
MLGQKAAQGSLVVEQADKGTVIEMRQVQAFAESNDTAHGNIRRDGIDQIDVMPPCSVFKRVQVNNVYVLNHITKGLSRLAYYRRAANHAPAAIFHVTDEISLPGIGAKHHDRSLCVCH